MVAVLAITSLLIGILAAVPPVDRDALTHHLFVPKLYLQNGGIYEIPEIPFSYYPMNLDLLYMIPLYFGNDIIPKYLHFSFALLTAFLIYRFLKERIGSVWGLMGALFFLTIPVITKLSITVYVDLGLIFFSTASLLFLLSWLDSDLDWRWLLLCGLCAGLAAGTKYNGLVTVAVIGLMVPFCYSRVASKKGRSQLKLGMGALIAATVFVAGVMCTYSPWLIRNYAWTGNPVYPLHKSFFSQSANNLKNNEQAETNRQIKNERSSLTRNIFVERRLIYGESTLDTLALPIRFFFQGQDDNPRYFDGKLSPFLLILPLCAFLGWRNLEGNRKREYLVLLSFALLYFFFTFFQTAMRVRYVSPSLPPLILLSTFGLHSLFTWINNKSKLINRFDSFVLVILFVVVMLPNYVYLKELFPKVRPFDYLNGTLDRDAYITVHRPEFTAIQWLNDRTEPDERVLCIFLGKRGYYMEFFPIFKRLYNSSSLRLPEQVNYALVRDDLFQAWLAYNAQQALPLMLPFNWQNPVFASQGYSVYEIERKTQRPLPNQ